LAAALGLSRAGAKVRLLERNAELTEVGAGIQLGPNVTRRLLKWQLQQALDDVVAYPDSVQTRDALTGEVTGQLPLGNRCRERYGAPYVTVHRADMQQVLLRHVQTHTDTRLSLGSCVSGFTPLADEVQVQTVEGLHLSCAALVGADGLWSRVRECLLADGQPRVTGHLAYRAVVLQRDLPVHLRSSVVTAWMGPRLHVVQYPVRRGEWLNVVAVVHTHSPVGDPQNWDQAAYAADLREALRDADAAGPLRELIAAIDPWRLWALCDRPPMGSAREQAQGRVALLGDAAHPMRPYMAQGAGMAIEDAAELGELVAQGPADVPAMLARYASARWERNARVQARAIRNGQIYHAQGVVRWGRNVALQALGRRIMDVPWLYQY
jgi:salicylate hydroxylase